MVVACSVDGTPREFPEFKVCERDLTTLCASEGACPTYPDALAALHATPMCAEGTTAHRQVHVTQCGDLRTIRYPGFVGLELLYDGGDVLTGKSVWSDLVSEEGCISFSYGEVGSCDTVVETVCLGDADAGMWCRASCER